MAFSGVLLILVTFSEVERLAEALLLSTAQQGRDEAPPCPITDASHPGPKWLHHAPNADLTLIHRLQESAGAASHVEVQPQPRPWL